MIIISRSTFFNALIASTTITYPSQSPPPTSSPQLPNPITEINYDVSSKFVRSKVKEIIQEDPTIAGPILRLAFHDAVVRTTSSSKNDTSQSSSSLHGGADGSIRYELEWSENRGLSKPLQAIQSIYESQSQQQQQSYHNNKTSSTSVSLLSFADVLALSGAAAVEAAKGPHIPIKLGRIDTSLPSTKYLQNEIKGQTERSTIKSSLPSAALDSLGLRIYFKKLIGLDDNEMVALMGAHDLGRHVTLTGMSKDCLKNLTRSCLENAPTLVPFVTKDVDTFSNLYYDTLLRWNERKIEYGEASFIPTDVALVVDDELREIVRKFAKDEKYFFETFTTAYQKLVDTTATTTLRY